MKYRSTRVGLPLVLYWLSLVVGAANTQAQFLGYEEVLRLAIDQEQSLPESYRQSLSGIYEQQGGDIMNRCYENLSQQAAKSTTDPEHSGPKHSGPKHSGALDIDLRSFTLVLSIGVQGEVVYVWMDEFTPLADCYRKAISAHRFPVPLTVPFYSVMEMRLGQEE
jgi:hypothetical protein